MPLALWAAYRKQLAITVLPSRRAQWPVKSICALRHINSHQGQYTAVSVRFQTLGATHSQQSQEPYESGMIWAISKQAVQTRRQRFDPSGFQGVVVGGPRHSVAEKDLQQRSHSHV